MKWWLEQSMRIQNQVRMDELKDANFDDQEYLKKFIVHAREDICSIFFLVSSLNDQAQKSRSILIVIVVLLAYIAYRLTVSR